MRLWPNRLYKSGMEWGLWLWTDVPTHYIVRLHLIKTPYFAVCLHWLQGRDPEPYPHDHPVSFLSLILRGGYLEYRRIGKDPSKGGVVCHHWCNLVRASPEDVHSICAVLPNTLTLCLMGRKRRNWGYHTPAGWVYWKEYNQEKYGTRKHMGQVGIAT